ncbi:Outer membrane lipoprotein-sorting protein [Sedimentisphaera cyanobacteriorum]|uniref:Outer membrane lipoprotein-sorting protein n=1 Tax=Sedimentisphaera cyanobacteriorum TaxID=1940790 RepID=A0A1Q2HQ34_9BACT|nr:outer membrane lipoprotein-sorting protein [Sedimentisphaera cyanobacteriorum]AQQ09538.1 Outer membrane lipoprotein-sorting protein [Sedimentisphaera cyanobacteriorum]
MRKLLTLAAVSALMFSSPAFSAEEQKSEMTVEKIVHNANRVSYYQGYDGKAEVSMKIVDSKDRERNRELIILRRDELNPSLPEEKARKDDSYCKEQKIYAYFTRPADVNKTVFMVWKHLTKDDDRWMYLPALDLVKRISATDKRTSFVGSHFFYEDVSGRSIKDDKHELVETTDNYYVLKNTPKDKELVEFEYYKMWIHKDSFVVVKSEYYNAQDEPYRVYEVQEVKDIEGYPTVTKSKMTDLDSGGYTVLTYSDVEYNIGIEESVFTERYLRRPARKYLR